MKKILLVEDEINVVSFIKKGLTEENFEVSVALDGNSCTQMAFDNDFDLIILDIMLPDTNGIEVCKILRNKNIQTPILFLTSLNTADNIALGLNSGGIAYYEVGSNLETQYLPMTCLPNNDYTATSLTCLGYMRFKYTVASSDSSADLTISSFNLNGSSIRNSSGGILDNSIIPTKNPQRSAYLKVN